MRNAKNFIAVVKRVNKSGEYVVYGLGAGPSAQEDAWDDASDWYDDDELDGAFDVPCTPEAYELASRNYTALELVVQDDVLRIAPENDKKH